MSGYRDSRRKTTATEVADGIVHGGTDKAETVVSVHISYRAVKDLRSEEDHLQKDAPEEPDLLGGIEVLVVDIAVDNFGLDTGNLGSGRLLLLVKVEFMIVIAWDGHCGGA